jgi:ribokinase
MSTGARIAVVGSANIDLTTFSDSFPRAGETLFGKRFALSFGGKGANQAVAARLCGADVLMIAKVGDDLFGEATIKNLESFGIDTRHVHVVGGVATGVAAIFVEPSGQNRIIVIKGANDLLMPADVDAAAAQLRDVDTIILQLEIPLETV